jgi:excinuclease ABC subunit A
MKHPLQARRLVAKVAPENEAKDSRFTLGTGEKDQKSDAIHWLALQGASLHNLQDVNAAIPLQRLVAVTGVSGSGKSTFARDVLLASVQALVAQRATRAGREAMAAGQFPALIGCTGLTGFETIDRVLEVDQTPIGKTPRSCPATYVGFWDAIRKLVRRHASTPSTRGYECLGRFSASIPAPDAARCCDGAGHPYHGGDELPARRQDARARAVGVRASTPRPCP